MAYRPTDYLAAKQIEHDSQKDPACGSRKIGYPRLVSVNLGLSQVEGNRRSVNETYFWDRFAIQLFLPWLFSGARLFTRHGHE